PCILRNGIMGRLIGGGTGFCHCRDRAKFAKLASHSGSRHAAPQPDDPVVSLLPEFRSPSRDSAGYQQRSLSLARGCAWRKAAGLGGGTEQEIAGGAEGRSALPEKL